MQVHFVNNANYTVVLFCSTKISCRYYRITASSSNIPFSQVWFQTLPKQQIELNLENFKANSFLSQSVPPFVLTVLFIPSFNVFELLFLFFTQFGGNPHCFNFDKFRYTASLTTRNSIPFYSDAPLRVTSKLNTWSESSNKRATLSGVAKITLELRRVHWNVEFQEI